MDDNTNGQQIGLTSYDAAEWILNTPEVSWIVEGLIPEKSKTLIVAGPKVGKSFFATALMKAIVDKGWFLDCRVPDIPPVWYFTEADEGDFKADCETLGFVPPYGQIEVFPLFENLTFDAEHLIREVISAYSGARQHGVAPGLLIIDVLWRWLGPPKSGDYGHIQKQLEPLDDLAFVIRKEGR